MDNQPEIYISKLYYFISLSFLCMHISSHDTPPLLYVDMNIMSLLTMHTSLTVDGTNKCPIRVDSCHDC